MPPRQKKALCRRARRDAASDSLPLTAFLTAAMRSTGAFDTASATNGSRSPVRLGVSANASAAANISGAARITAALAGICVLLADDPSSRRSPRLAAYSASQIKPCSHDRDHGVRLKGNQCLRLV